MEIIPVESVESLEARLAKLKKSNPNMANVQSRIAAMRAEVAKLRTLADNAKEQHEEITQVLNGRRNVVTRQPDAAAQSQSLENDLNVRTHAMEEQVDKLQSEFTPAGTPAQIAKIKLHLDAARALDGRLEGGILGKVGLNKPFGQRFDGRWKSFKIAESDMTYMTDQIQGEKDNFSTQREGLDAARKARWDKALADIALWKESNEAVNVCVRDYATHLQTVGELRCCAIFRAVMYYRDNGVQQWKIHRAARMLFVPFARTDIERQLRKLGCHVQSALLFDGVISIADGVPVEHAMTLRELEKLPDHYE